jgi:hypothetical protein
MGILRPAAGKKGKGEDMRGYRADFIRLVHRAMAVHF